MTLQDAITTLQQFERLDDCQVSEIVGFMTGQAARIEREKIEAQKTEKFYQGVNVGLCKDYFAVIKEQDEKIIGLQQRVRELDEKNQTQALVLAARDKIIQQQVCIQHAYRDERAALKKDLAASRRCGSCRHWDEKAHRCCNSNSQLFSVLSVLRYETCDGWDNLQNLYKQRDGE